MTRVAAMLLAPMVVALVVAPLLADELAPRERIAIEGALSDPENLSGIAIVGNRLIVCGDETAALDVLERNGNRLRVAAAIPLDDEDVEIDMEGLAAQGNRLYVIGSHSLARKTVKDNLTYEENQERLRSLDPDEHRDQLLRVKFDDEDKVYSIKRTSLRSRLARHKILGLFTSLPSKENGVDIEGLALRDDRLYVGFRGPVLRGNLVPIASLEFSDDEDEKLRVNYVTLDGLGIRDLAAARDEFLILAGPVGDGPGGYAVYSWDGKDCLGGQGSPGGQCKRLAQLQPIDSGKPEGMAIERETDTHYELLLVADGVSNVVFRYSVCKRP